MRYFFIDVIKKDGKSIKIKHYRTKNDELQKVPLKMRFPQKKHEITIFGG